MAPGEITGDPRSGPTSCLSRFVTVDADSAHLRDQRLRVWLEQPRLAGEFGMVLQSADEGETWIRRDTVLVDREPEPPYWLSGVQQGDTMHLAGAAGVSSKSMDGGVTWHVQPRPGNEGIFGITLLDSGEPLIAGAVGLIGKLEGSTWSLADRTQLKLLSWLKNPVPLADGSVLMLGGRSTAISYKDGQWTRVPVDVR